MIIFLLNRKTNLILWLILLFCLTSSIIYSAVIINDPSKEFSNDTSTIAMIGNVKITVNEFLESYEYGPSFIKKMNNPKKAFLEFMINEKLIAQEGYSSHRDTSEQIEHLINEIEDDLAVTEWFKDKVIPLIHIDSLRIKKSVEEEAVKIKFRYIFSENQNEIQLAQTKLKKGVSFDSLYEELKDNDEYFIDEVPSTFFSILKDNSIVAESLSKLPVGSTSDIINSDDGYFIVHLDQASKNMVSTKYEYERIWHHMEKRFQKLQTDSISTVFLKSLLEKCPPTIRGESLKTLLNRMVEAFQLHNNENKWTPDNFVLLQNITEKQRADESGDNVLSESSCDNFTINDFIQWYKLRQVNLNLQKPNSETLKIISSLVFKMVRDKRLIALVRKSGYQNLPAVRMEKNYWKDKLVYWSQRNVIITLPDFKNTEIRSFYEKHKSRYTRNNKNDSFDEVQLQVEEEMKLIEINKTLLNYINKLKQKYPVVINEKILSELKVSDERLNKKLDVFVVKKGGTLPRQAFPTIDNEWRYY